MDQDSQFNQDRGILRIGFQGRFVNLHRFFGSFVAQINRGQASQHNGVTRLIAQLFFQTCHNL
jgi:hypothetical protein